MYSKSYLITESELEPGYNHLNHASILTLLEKARLDYLISVGFPNEVLHQKGIFLVIAHIDVHYKREVFSGENIVTIDNVTTAGKQMLMTQRALNPKGKECVSAKYDFRVLSAELRKSIEIPADLAKAMAL
jgi:YbgC/YbaW family acyl-CoA thioester hydrolase